MTTDEGYPAETDAELTAFLHAQVPFAEVLGLNAVRAIPEEVIATCDHQPDRCTAAGLLHGGYLMAVVDTVGATCAALNLPPDSATSTIESKSNFFRPVTEGSVTVTASPIHVGSSVIVVQTDTTNGAEAGDKDHADTGRPPSLAASSQQSAMGSRLQGRAM